MFLRDAIIYQFTCREATSPRNKHARCLGGGAVGGGIAEGLAVEELSDLSREM